MRLIYLFILLTAIVTECRYKIQFYHTIIPYVDTNYFKHFKVYNTFYNRTSRMAALTMNIKKKVDSKWHIVIASYKFLDNQFKRFVPLTMGFPLCAAIDNNWYGVQTALLSVSNLTKCPILVGSYYVNDISAVPDKVPPYIPHGKYKLVFNVTVSDHTVASIEWQGLIGED